MHKTNQKLAAARVLIVGLGALGSPVALYLAAAGVGHLGLIDAELIEKKHLRTAVIFTGSAVGQAKVHAARARLLALNNKLQISIHKLAVNDGNAAEIIGAYDLVVDCSRSAAAHRAISDACLSLGKSFVFGSLSGAGGQVSLFCSEDGPCYRCFHVVDQSDFAEETDEIVGSVAGVIGSLAATQAVKFLLGENDKNLSGQVLSFDSRDMTFATTALPADPGCICRHPVRQSAPIRYINEEISASPARMQSGPGSAAAQSISPAELAEKLDDGSEDILLLDVRALKEHRAMRLRGSKLIQLQDLPDKLDELVEEEMSDPERTVVVYCRSGVRSRKACSLLRDSGFENVRNLTGGILAWYREFEEKMIESDASMMGSF